MVVFQRSSSDEQSSAEVDEPPPPDACDSDVEDVVAAHDLEGLEAVVESSSSKEAPVGSSVTYDSVDWASYYAGVNESVASVTAGWSLTEEYDQRRSSYKHPIVEAFERTILAFVVGGLTFDDMY